MTGKHNGSTIFQKIMRSLAPSTIADSPKLIRNAAVHTPDDDHVERAYQPRQYVPEIVHEFEVPYQHEVRDQSATHLMVTTNMTVTS